jgi:hypothetical protein
MAAAVPAGRRGREEVTRARLFLPDSGLPSCCVEARSYGLDLRDTYRLVVKNTYVFFSTKI